MTETITEAPAWTAPPVPQVPPVELMTVAELRHHLGLQHGGQPYRSTKWSKDRLVAHHQEQHDIDAFEEFQPRTLNASLAYPPRADGRSWVSDHWVHTHANVEPTPQQAEALAKLREGQPPGKVLSASERKNLQELVDNDFGSLKAQTKRFATEAEAAETAAIVAEWESKLSRVDVWVDRYRALQAKQREEHQKLVAQAIAAGVSLNNGVGTVRGRDEALAEVRARYSSQLASAQAQIEAQRLGAQRTILMAGVSAEGLTLLATIPTAQEAMLAAAARSAKQLEQ